MSGGLRAAIIGAGFIADYHAAALAKTRGVTLAAVCDVSHGRAAALAERYGAIANTSLGELLERVRPEVVHICTPPDLHGDLAVRCLAGGAHVFLEKPMGVSVPDCERMIAAARSQRRVLGVNHTLRHYPVFSQLRADVQRGRIGRPDHVRVAWNKELPFLRFGPFDVWMLRAPGNVVLELGSHLMALLLDLLGAPGELTARADRRVMLPGERPAFRRWHVHGPWGPANVDIHMSLGPGFAERVLQIRGTLGVATVDFERNTYTLDRQTKHSEDFDRYAMLTRLGRALIRQSRGNLKHYALEKFGRSESGKPFDYGMLRAVRAFYEGLRSPSVPTGDGEFGRDVVAACEAIVRAAGLEATRGSTAPATGSNARPAALAGVVADVAGPSSASADALVIGATGFIGKALVRELLAQGRAVRVLVRRPGAIPPGLRDPCVQVMRGDVTDSASVAAALHGVRHVYHLAIVWSKTWREYYENDVQSTRRLAEACLTAGVARLVYTGTIASLRMDGDRPISDESPLDARLEQRSSYARAKGESERILMDLQRTRGLPVVIARPGIVLGAGGNAMHFGIGDWNGPGVCRLRGPSRHPLPLVLVEDVAAGLRLAAETDGVVGRAFNLVGPPLLSARDYLAEMQRLMQIEVQVFESPIWKTWLFEQMKWVVKQAVRHPERRRVEFAEVGSFAHRAPFDTTGLRQALDWRPEEDRAEFVRRGIQAPAEELWR